MLGALSLQLLQKGYVVNLQQLDMGLGSFKIYLQFSSGRRKFLGHGAAISKCVGFA